MGARRVSVPPHCLMDGITGLLAEMRIIRRIVASLQGRPLMANPPVLFLAVVLLATFFAVLLPLTCLPVLGVVARFTAAASAFLLQTAGLHANANGANLVVNLGGRVASLVIAYGCDGVLDYLILASAILPFPCRVRAKVVGLGAGLVFVFVVNQGRILGLAFMLALLKDRGQFGFYHVWLGQLFTIGMVFFFWSVWAARVARQMRAQAGPPQGTV